MIKIAHESPIAIFDDVQKVTDIDYALVHLFETHPVYFDKFKKAVENGREVILDNSIFELGKAFEPNTYRKWIRKLEPTWYIIPDVLEDAVATIESKDRWFDELADFLPGKTIAVAQGATYFQFAYCYEELANDPRVDMIGISFDYSFFESWYPPNQWPVHTKYHSWSLGREELLHRLGKDGILNANKPHHLLGCGLPQEFIGYADEFPWIYSVDTSNPVVHGLKNIHYDFGMLNNKESVKLFELIDTEVSKEQYDVIMSNINSFRKNVRNEQLPF